MPQGQTSDSYTFDSYTFDGYTGPTADGYTGPTGAGAHVDSSRIRALIALHGDVDTDFDPYLDDSAIGVGAPAGLSDAA